MSIPVAERTKRIKPSPTLAVTQRAAELKAQGRNIIDLGAGEPDFDTPEHIKDAAIMALKMGFTKYTAVDGIPDLKQAIIDKFKRDNRLIYNPNQILVSSGGKQSFFNLCQALLNDGDEVVIPAPYWVSYPDIVSIAGGIPVFIKAGIDQHFKITPEQLDAAITRKTKVIVLNSPSNPTGVAYTHDELVRLGEVLREHPNVLIATDDMYEHIWYHQDKFWNIVMACPELYDRTMVLNGLSKAYAMTGWRIGYAAGPAEIIAVMKKIQSQSTSNPTSIAQKASVAALKGDQHCVVEMVEAFRKRHAYVIERLNAMEGIECLPADGAFYAFPHVQQVIDRLDGIHNDLEFSEYLLEKADVAVVPGSAFGAPGYVRLSFATSLENLSEALNRIENAIS